VSEERVSLMMSLALDSSLVEFSLLHAMLEVLMDLDLRPGDTIRRVELHRRYGGGGQGGISPSTKTPNVFIFSDPARGEQHGYIDACEQTASSTTRAKGNVAISR
jgi:hypothetical protein